MKPIYTPETRITFGMYKNAMDNRLVDLPHEYLRKIIKDPKLDPELVRVICEDILKEPLPRKPLDKSILLTNAKDLRKQITGCSKIGFYSKKLANAELKRFQNTIKTGVVPVRSYECEICGAWHHTSKENKKIK